MSTDLSLISPIDEKDLVACAPRSKGDSTTAEVGSQLKMA